MRRSQLVQLGSCVLSGLLVTVSAGADEPGLAAVAARVEAYLGGAVVHQSGNDRESGVDAGGVGSFSALFGPVYFQADIFGDYAAFNRPGSDVGFGGHLGISDPELYAVGATFSYQQINWRRDLRYRRVDDDYLRAGGEAELYLDALTLGVMGGYLENAEREKGGYYARGLVRYYLTDDLKLEGVGGVAKFGSGTQPQARALVEYRPQGWPLGFFTRWEGAFKSGLDQNFAVLGFRLYLEGLSLDSPRSLRSTDRSYFREGCQGFLFGARAC
ncbi:MAG: hypothetical protein E4H11_00750 [Myxococcales bacterium]|nr:MAG: hypothetical protein E4H11_00750 [Myxococcales bacterium]